MLRRLLRLSMSPNSRQSLHPRLWVRYAIGVVVWCLFADWQYRVHQARCRAYHEEHWRMSLLEQACLVAPLNAQARPVVRLCNAMDDFRLGLESPVLKQVLLAVSQNARVAVSRITIEDVERRLNNGEPFQLSSRIQPDNWWDPCTGRNYSRMFTISTANWCDPQGRIRGELVFRDGVFMGFNRTWPVLEEPEDVFVCSQTAVFMGDVLKRTSQWIWGLLVLFGLCRARSRFLALELSLMWLVVTGLVRLPPLAADPQWERVLRHPYWPWLLTMVSWSLAVLAWAWFRQGAKHRLLCPVCEYNLTGNRSGICPECGAPVPAEILERLRRGPQAGSSPSGSNAASCPEFQQLVDGLDR